MEFLLYAYRYPPSFLVLIFPRKEFSYTPASQRPRVFFFFLFSFSFLFLFFYVFFFGSQLPTILFSFKKIVLFFKDNIYILKYEYIYIFLFSIIKNSKRLYITSATSLDCLGNVPPNIQGSVMKVKRVIQINNN